MTFKRMPGTNLTYRFDPALITTAAVFSVDDDVVYSCDLMALVRDMDIT